MKFGEWFDAQHGKREPRDKRSDAELKDTVSAGIRAEHELNRRRTYDARRESALYAWQAREKAVAE